MRGGSDVDVAVVGGGIVGLAVAAELLDRGASVVVFERNPRPGQETTARNSGVIHAGLYYPTDSLKARMCVDGRRRLLAFCDRHRVPHRITGKLIVACDPEEEGPLEELLSRAHANGVSEVRRIPHAEIRRREPQVRAVAALWSPVTGIVDTEELVRALDRTLSGRGGHLLTDHEVVGLHREDRGWAVELRPSRGVIHTVRATAVVNAAGLWAGEVAGLAGRPAPRLYLCKGVYFWTPRPLVRGLVYPLPEAGLRGLGIHATVDLSGRVRFGPDTEFVDRLGYGVDVGRAARFHRAITRYLPGLALEDLRPDTAGIRPRLAGPGDTTTDFRIDGSTGGDDGTLVSLFGIESPGLTASLALAREVAARLGFESSLA